MIYGLIGFGIIVLICTGIFFAAKLDECDVEDVGICLFLSFISGIMCPIFLIITLALVLIVISLPVLLCSAIIMEIITSII